MNQLIKKYLLSLQYEKGLSSKTIDSYSIDLNKYVQYLDKKYSISKPDDIYMKHIKSFMSSYLKFYVPKKQNEKKKEYSINTLSRYFSSIRGFHRYLINEGLSKRDPSMPKNEL